MIARPGLPAALASLAAAFMASVSSAQAVLPAYHPLQLDCARYHQDIASTILLAGPGQRSRETTRRDGVLSVRAEGRDSVIALEAWFDSLTLWREGSGERLEPDADGVIGGRFTGVLTRLGGYAELDRPFVPDEVAEVADVGDALAELFPPLPGRPLAPGTSWRDDLGTVITRLPDSRRDALPVERYRLTRRSERRETRLLPDSSEVSATRRDSETGVYEWSAELGPVRWEREITVEVDVPAGGLVKRPFRSKIEQQVTIERRPGACPTPAP